MATTTPSNTCQLVLSMCAYGWHTGKGQQYAAMFNLDDRPASLDTTWSRLGLAPGKHAARNLWDGHRLAASGRLKVVLPAHGCVLYALEPH